MYEKMRQPRMMDDSNSGKNLSRPDDIEMHNIVEHPAPNTATEAPISDHEVSEMNKICKFFDPNSSIELVCFT